MFISVKWDDNVWASRLWPTGHVGRTKFSCRGKQVNWFVEHALYLQRRLCAMNISMKIALKSNNKHRSYRRISFRGKQVCSQPESMQHFFLISCSSRLYSYLFTLRFFSIAKTRAVSHRVIKCDLPNEYEEDELGAADHEIEWTRLQPEPVVVYSMPHFEAQQTASCSWSCIWCCLICCCSWLRPLFRYDFAHTHAYTQGWVCVWLSVFVWLCGMITMALHIGDTHTVCTNKGTYAARILSTQTYVC